jgi:hypothetical protein
VHCSECTDNYTPIIGLWSAFVDAHKNIALSGGDIPFYTNQAHLFVHLFYALNTHERKVLLIQAVEATVDAFNSATQQDMGSQCCIVLLQLVDYLMRNFVDCTDELSKYMNQHILPLLSPQSFITSLRASTLHRAHECLVADVRTGAGGNGAVTSPRTHRRRSLSDVANTTPIGPIFKSTLGWRTNELIHVTPLKHRIDSVALKHLTKNSQLYAKLYQLLTRLAHGGVQLLTVCTHWANFADTPNFVLTEVAWRLLDDLPVSLEFAQNIIGDAHTASKRSSGVFGERLNGAELALWTRLATRINNDAEREWMSVCSLIPVPVIIVYSVCTGIHGTTMPRLC